MFIVVGSDVDLDVVMFGFMCYYEVCLLCSLCLFEGVEVVL